MNRKMPKLFKSLGIFCVSINELKLGKLNQFQNIQIFGRT